MKRRVILIALIAVTLLAASPPPRDLGSPVPASPLPPLAHALFLPLAANSAYVQAAPQALIAAFLPDGQAANDIDEAVAIQNIGLNPLSLNGWMITDGEGTAILPELALAVGDRIWCARQATAFRQQWGFDPACEYELDSDAAVPDATGSAPRLGNSGDELQLLRPDGRVADAVVFADGDSTVAGWTGGAVEFYQRSTRFAREGQIFYRLFDPASGQPDPDTDSAADWAQGNNDPTRGRRAAYPGWDFYEFARPWHVNWPQPHPAKLLLMPDNAFAAVQSLFASAQTSIHIETYEFEHPDLVATLVERAGLGVEIRMLLEGAPTGGLTDQSRWAAQQISEAGGQVHFMVNDGAAARDRYPYQHAKFALIDGHTLLLSTENFKVSSMPPDAADGETWGRRGYGLIVSDPTLIARVQAIFAADNDPAHSDIFPFRSDHPSYGAPPPGFTPPIFPNQSGYPVRQPWPQPISLAQASVFSAPEATLTPGPLLDLLARAGENDTILVQQLYEHSFWGATSSNPAADPNPRLEALIAAARRGASVRLLLDSWFDNPFGPRSNAATADYVNGIAAVESLDLKARLGNPAGGGLHAKLHLIAIGPERWVVLGSINGSEVSNKLNRELGIAFESADGFRHLAEIFWEDWSG